jgi:hypoxanthine phosphoribosyltransferase
MGKKIWYSWEEMRRDVSVLSRELVLDNYNPQVIVGISRGGLIPGVMLSHWFQKPFKPIKASMRDFAEEDDAWEDYYPRKSDERVLIVDDICDSGKTFTRISDKIKQRKEYTRQHRHSKQKHEILDVRFASLWWNNECSFEPHYYAQECAKDSEDIWIQFPHEHWWNAPV